MGAEKSNALREAREALNLVNLNIPAFPIGSSIRGILEQTASELESLVWKLVHQDLKEISDELNKHQSHLQKLTTNMETAVSSLEKVKHAVENVSNIIGSLASLMVLVGGWFTLYQF